MTSELDQLSELIPDGEALSLSRELIRIPSVFGNEQAIAEFVHRRLGEWGLSSRFVSVDGFGPCVVADIGNPESPKIVLNGHMDTVEVMSGWIHDPFDATVEDGILYGLGSLDMKCGLAGMMLAFRALSESELTKSHQVSFHAVSGEEKDGNGTRTLISSGEYKNASAVIVGEGFGGLRVITHGRRGGSYYDITVKGKSAHGAVPHMGVNAVVDAASIVTALGSLKLNPADGLVSEDGSPLGESVTILSIKGGTGSLSVPDNCAIRLVKCTIPNGATDVTDEIESLIAELGLRSSVSVVFNTDPKDLYHPHLTLAESPVVIAASESIQQHLGWKPTLVCGVSEADDNVIAHETGLPVICVGPGESGKAARYHQAEEAIQIGQLDDAARLYVQIIERLCGAV